MNKELMEALDILEREKEISKDTLFEAIENSLLTACKNHFGKSDNIKVEIDRDTCDFICYAEKEVVEDGEVEDDCLQISLEDAREVSHNAQLGDMLHIEIKSKELAVQFFSVFQVERETTNQRNNPSKVQLGEPESSLRWVPKA